MQRFITAALLWAFSGSAGSMALADQLYWNSSNVIHRASLTGVGVQDLTPTIQNGGIALDPAGDRMFWTGELPTVPAGPTGVIRRSALDGSGAVAILSNIPTPIGIALDVARGKMYWTAADNAIRRADLDGANVEELVKQDSIAQLSGVALDLVDDRLYFSFVNPLVDGPLPGAIGSTDLDGTGFQLVVGALVNPQGVGLDVAGGQVYWADATQIARADFSGLNRQNLVSGLVQPFGVALDLTGKNIFWTDTLAGKIQSAPLAGGGASDVLIDLANPTAIALLTTVPEPESLVLSAVGLLALAAGRVGRFWSIRQPLSAFRAGDHHAA